MFNVFENKTKDFRNSISDEDLLKKYKKISSSKDYIKKVDSSLDGLTTIEAKKRLKENGKNIVIKEIKHSYFYYFFQGFKDQFVLILLVMAVINLMLGDKLGSLIIVFLVLISIIIRSIQEYSTYLFDKKLKDKMVTSSIIVRDGKEKKVNTDNVVIGDIVSLNAGTIIPADTLILSSNNLYINQSIFTGESVPVRKSKNYHQANGIIELNNILLMGSSVTSGSGIGLVINTGFNTYLGRMNKVINSKKDKTDFEKGMDKVSAILIKFMVIVSILVFIINFSLRHDLVSALMFAISVAVGITPGMLPTIVNVNLTRGAKNLEKKKTLVKNGNAIENLGAIDILCTDKTGTLTDGQIKLQTYVDPDGDESKTVLNYAYMNSYYGTGQKNIIDKAIISYGDSHNVLDKVKNYHKVYEIPFDYDRRKMSVFVTNKKTIMITKGALEEIFKCSSYIMIKNKKVKLTKEYQDKVMEYAKNLSLKGMQVIGLATREFEEEELFNKSYEQKMTFVGIIGFLDPPKKGVKTILNKIKKIGVKTKILTGDNPYAAQVLANLCDLKFDPTLTGDKIDKMNDFKLKKVIEENDIFARLNPMQKERIIKLYRQNGHVVGYMGDGVNDAPSLHAADVGICVNNGASIAKESADIIILEKSLKVIYDGIIEGRKTYGNIMKYMKMAISANFGDAFSILIASIFLPFLPILPFQMLIQDLLYEMSQIMIPFDDVDEEFLEEPKRWDTSDLSRFMIIMGLTSTVVDVVAFLIFWYILGYNSVDKAAYFQTAWFIEGLISQTMIVHYVRTSKIPFIESRANPLLTMSTTISIILSIIIPYLLKGVKSFHFVILPLKYYYFVVFLLVLYSLIEEIVKELYIKKYHKWL